MIALLLCAGLGERLRPITNHVPKCMVPIGGRPLLDFWIENMIGLGVSKIYINTHYLSDVVTAFVEKHNYRDRIELIKEPTLLGTGGTLKTISNIIEDEEVLLVHADNFCIAAFGKFLQCFKSRQSHVEIAMMTFRTDIPSSCGIVEVLENGIVNQFHEKVSNPPGDLASGAVFLISSNVVQFVKKQKLKVFDFSKEIIPQFLGKIISWENTTYHRDIGTPESYQKCLSDWKNLKNVKVK
jgi:mannose-1-phosphate guanylyltransferase